MLNQYLEVLILGAHIIVHLDCQVVHFHYFCMLWAELEDVHLLDGGDLVKPVDFHRLLTPSMLPEIVRWTCSELHPLLFPEFRHQIIVLGRWTCVSH